MNTKVKLIGLGLLLILTIIIGYILSSLGRPLNSVLFNLHKFIALAFVIITFLIVRNTLGFNNLKGSLLLLILITGFSVIVLFASGALLSNAVKTDNLLLLIHNMSTVLILISTTWAFYLIKSLVK